MTDLHRSSGRSQEEDPAPELSDGPRITVVVCSFNGARKLPACLESLRSQTLAGVDVVVVDDGSTDGTAAVAERFADVRVLRHTTNSGLAAARNTGLAAVDTELVAFTDDDCIPDPRWLHGLVRLWNAADPHGARQAVGGSVEPARTDTFARRYIASDNPLRPLELSVGRDTTATGRLLRHLRGQIMAEGAPDRPRPVHSLVGANMAFQTEALRRVGGFDSRITFGGEEEDVCRRINEMYGPGSVTFDPTIVVRHDYEPSVRDALRRRRAYGRGNARTFLKAGMRIPPVPPAALAAVAIAVWVLRDRRAAPWLAVPIAWYVVGQRRAAPTPAQSYAFAGMKFLEEVSTFAGFVEGWIRYRREYL